MHRTSKILLLFLLVGLLPLAVPFSQAGDASRLSGTYRVLEKTDVGSQTRVRIQLRLTNREARQLHIERFTLWDFSHPHQGGTRPCAVVLNAGASVETTQEFLIPHAEYELWARGTRPRLVVEVESSHGRTVAQPVRLAAEFKGKAE